MNQHIDTVIAPVLFDRSSFLDVDQLLARAISDKLPVCSIIRYIVPWLAIVPYYLLKNEQIEFFIAFLVAKLKGRERTIQYVKSVGFPLARETYHKINAGGVEYTSEGGNNALAKYCTGLTTLSI